MGRDLMILSGTHCNWKEYMSQKAEKKAAESCVHNI